MDNYLSVEKRIYFGANMKHKFERYTYNDEGYPLVKCSRCGLIVLAEVSDNVGRCSGKKKKR